MAQSDAEKKEKKAAANKRYAAKKKAAKLEAAATPAPVAKKQAAPKKATKKVVAKKAAPKKAKAPSKNVDVISDFLKIGDTAKIKSKASASLGKMIDARVVKIYACGRTGKDYVRLKADGQTFHKRLNHFAPAE